MALRREQHFIIIGAIAGLVLGATLGAWSLASQRPGRAGVHTASGPPPAAPRCPNGYRAATGLDANATLEGSLARWLVRCEPLSSGSPISDALELFWTPEMYIDGRLRSDRLVDFVRAIAPEPRVAFERALRPEATNVRGTSTAYVTADGTYRLPALGVRVWVLPAGANSLQVTLVAPTERLDEAAAIVRRSLARIEGLAPWDPTREHGERGFSVRVACPEGYTDATPADGGPSRNTYVGRYCLAPGESAGLELTFAEVTARADTEDGFRNLLDVSRSAMASLGVVTGAGFSPTQSIEVAGNSVRTARLEATPNPARIRLFAYQLTSDQGSLFASVMALRDNSNGARDALRAWLDDMPIVRAYDPEIVERRRRERIVAGVVLPALITCVLGAFLARWRARSGPVFFKQSPDR